PERGKDHRRIDGIERRGHEKQPQNGEQQAELQESGNAEEASPRQHLRRQPLQRDGKTEGRRAGECDDEPPREQRPESVEESGTERERKSEAGTNIQREN